MTSAERAALARQVKRVRLERHMKQAELAAAANVSRQTLSDIEKGSRVPQDNVLRRIMGVLGIEVPGREQAEDTRMWLGLIGGVLDALPVDRRERAGRAALDAATSELLAISQPDNVVQGRFGVSREVIDRSAASPRGEDTGEDGEYDG